MFFSVLALAVGHDFITLFEICSWFCWRLAYFTYIYLYMVTECSCLDGDPPFRASDTLSEIPPFGPVTLCPFGNVHLRMAIMCDGWLGESRPMPLVRALFKTSRIATAPVNRSVAMKASTSLVIYGCYCLPSCADRPSLHHFS